MNAQTTKSGLTLIDRIAQAVLYEGYALYPYRACVKNARRWMWGVLYPEMFAKTAKSGDTGAMHTEVPLQVRLASPGKAEESASVHVRVRFLRMVSRTIEKCEWSTTEWPLPTGCELCPVTHLVSDGQVHQPWQAGEECEIAAEPLKPVEMVSKPEDTVNVAFSLCARQWREPIRNRAGVVVGASRFDVAALEGLVELSCRPLGDDAITIKVRVVNRTPIPATLVNDRERSQHCSLLSTHVVLEASGAEFISTTDPLPGFERAADACKSHGLWPVLVGEAPDRHTMLAAPIILGDYPRIAPESFGDMFDATEIDEILTLRIRTMTDDEKAQAASLDPRLAALIEHADSRQDDELVGLHGAARRSALSRDCPAQIGDRVILHPKRQADIFDMALANKPATVMAVQEDFEGRIHVSVVVDEDPGFELGIQGKPGHRFFFSIDEIEVVKRAREVQT